MRFEYGGILGLAILAADIWAILNVFQSGATNGVKVVWTPGHSGPAGARPRAVVLSRAARQGRLTPRS